MDRSDNFWDNKLIYSPSLICLDPCNLESQVRVLESSGVEVLHIDIIDGHFSPSLPLGLDTVKALRKITNLSFDAHLMTEPNGYFIDELLDIGVDQLIFHFETEKHPNALLSMLKNRGVRAGIALKPSTPVSAIDCILECCDTVLLMLINPGCAGYSWEKQIPFAQRKVDELHRIISERKLPVKMELDGRISKESINTFGKDAADIFVIGSTCLSKNNLKSDIDELYSLREKLIGETV